LQIRNYRIQLSTTYKSLGGIYDGDKKFNYDYVMLSPVFENYKSSYQSGFSEYSLKIAMEETNMKVIARGGIDPAVIEKANSMGFYGIALYSYIWKNKDPIASFRKIIEKYKELDIPIN
jgi:thiamine monophosphate synthase